MRLTWWALATGVLAGTAIRPDGSDGLLFGNAVQLWIQVVSVSASALYSSVTRWIILKVLNALMGLRLSEEMEIQGMDTLPACAAEAGRWKLKISHTYREDEQS